MSAADTAPRTNALIARLSKETQHQLLAHCTRVGLTKHETLVEAGDPLEWTYLPCSGLVSLQTMTEDAATVEIALIGREGVVGMSLAQNQESLYAAVVIVPGEALRLRSAVLQAECERSPALQRALLFYTQALVNEMAQGTACHCFHTARQRMARWLLTVSDRTHTPRIEMTQARLGQSLGLQRTGATAASIALQDLGAIKARHGRITILDRRKMEAAACECYRRDQPV
ncbi:MAG TPA: Crp/Fnr family transcriptional regulator [Povalibacter sp.]|nr:Crp/Fnr family transcriptional regulator [Povalibacter sp.]